jgi:hypothetical protein
MEHRYLYRVSLEEHAGRGERLTFRKKIHTSVTPAKESGSPARVTARELLSDRYASWRFLRDGA